MIRRLAVAGLVLAAVGCSSATAHKAAPPPVPSTLAPTTSTSTTTTTTIDPGLLAQTTTEPSSSDPTFLARVHLLWQAVTTGQVGVGLPAFFPLTAYEQVKALPDPASDWQHRLVADYYSDIRSVHASLPAGAVFDAVSVPADATWVGPGEEVNKIGYWRVYNTRVTYSAGGTAGSFIIISLISWRGQWYVVHFRTPPS